MNNFKLNEVIFENTLSLSDVADYQSYLIKAIIDYYDFPKVEKLLDTGDFRYVVTMYRNGNRNKHSYVLGSFTNLAFALFHAEVEIIDRANKYQANVVKCNDDNLEYSEEYWVK